MSDIVEGFTPGPWRVEASPDAGHSNHQRHQTYSIMADGERLAVCAYKKNEEANARLIASAPDMAGEILRLRTALSTAREDALRALYIADQFMGIACDWNFDEAEIDGEMRKTFDLQGIIRAAILSLINKPQEQKE